MHAQLTVSIWDIILTLLSVAGIAVLIYLFLVLKEAYQTLREVKTLMKERRVEIDELLQKAPSIVGNVDKVTGIVAKGVDGAYNGALGIVNKFKGD